MIEDLVYAIKSRSGFESKSNKWKHWKATLDLKTCYECRTIHGKIYSIYEPVSPMPPLHWCCRCEITPMNAFNAEDCTKQGVNGAPYLLKNYGLLPEYYITGTELQSLGWKWGKAPSKYAPGKMAMMGIYRNDNGHLPSAPGRVWYEADINYTDGRRNAQRVLWSNDGLVFVTYDHYQTFVEVV